MTRKSSLNPRSAGDLLQSLRKNRRGGPGKGRPVRPTYCRICGVLCPSAVLAYKHCGGKSSLDPRAA